MTEVTCRPPPCSMAFITWLFIDGLAVVRIGIDANRLWARFSGPMGQTQAHKSDIALNFDPPCKLLALPGGQARAYGSGPR